MESREIIDGHRILSAGRMTRGIECHVKDLKELLMLGEEIELAFLRALCDAAKSKPPEFLLRVVAYVENHLAGEPLLKDEEEIHQYVMSFRVSGILP